LGSSIAEYNKVFVFFNFLYHIALLKVLHAKTKLINLSTINLGSSISRSSSSSSGGSGSGGSSSSTTSLSVQLQQLGSIKLGGLDNLKLVDENILEGVDSVALLLNLLSDGVGDPKIFN
jgi:hypothetical protein